MSDDLKIILNAEPYFYNCRLCGKPIFEKTMATTEIARRRGFCDHCTKSMMRKVWGRILVVEMPPATARWN